MTRIVLLAAILAVASVAPAGAQVAYATRAAEGASFTGTTTVPGDWALNPTAHYEPAPMPDEDILPPVPHDSEHKAAQLTPSLFQPKNQYRGDGFSPGSTVQGSQERQLKPAPGLSMKVPLN